MRGSRGRARHDRAVINCQYSMATFSTAERKRRPHGDRKSTEMSLHLKQTFEAAVMTQLFPRSQIDIYVKVSVLICSLLVLRINEAGVLDLMLKNPPSFLDFAVGWRQLQRMRKRRHIGCNRCRHSHERLRMRLHCRICGRDTSG